MTKDARRFRLGNRIAPPRFVGFIVIAAIGAGVFVPAAGWRIGIMAAFDVAALVFLAVCLPLLAYKPAAMREAARRNDANRVLLLVITAIVSLAILVAIASELGQKGAPHPLTVLLIVGTLLTSWFFTNFVFTLHYAHLFYTAEPDGEGDRGGLEFPKTGEPDYWDFVYFSFCLGMTFQTSDVDTTDRRFRRTVTGHCLAAFVFNLGVLAFTINVLGGS